MKIKGETELKEARGKTIKRVVVVSDFDQRDVEIEFEDGTCLHIGMTPTIRVISHLLPAEKAVRSA